MTRTCHGCYLDDRFLPPTPTRCLLCKDGDMYRSAKDDEPRGDDAGEPIEYDEREDRT